jgi:hypothetical protein
MLNRALGEPLRRRKKIYVKTSARGRHDSLGGGGGGKGFGFGGEWRERCARTPDLAALTPPPRGRKWAVRGQDPSG